MAAHRGVRGLSVSLAPSSSAICLHKASVCCLLYILIVPTQWFPVPSFFTPCSLCQWTPPLAFLCSHPAGRRTLLLLLSYFLLLQLSWRAKLLLMKSQGGQSDGWHRKDGKVAFMRLELVPLVLFTQRHSEIARHHLAFWSDGVF